MATDLSTLLDKLDTIVFGQRLMFRRILTALLTSGHVLLEGVPGVAKTTAVRILSGTLGLSFSRLQFTPDLLPGDLTGVQTYRPETGEFVIHKGPVFANLVLADEINRAPAKVQSALLQAMAEREVTIAEQTMLLPQPFIVLATQNPLEQEGTYQLPEAQLDRFMFKVRVGYPQRAAEQEMLTAALAGRLALDSGQLLSAADLAYHMEQVTKVTIAAEIQQYLLDLAAVTREPARYGAADLAEFLDYGVSPRGLIQLALASRAEAYLAGRFYVTPEDVQQVLGDCWGHRLGLSFQARAEGVTSDNILTQLLHLVAVP